MGILARLEKKPARAARATGFAAADTSRLAASLATESEFINRTLRYQLRMLRARSRQLAMNNAYGKRFAQMVVSGICGAHPFILQAKVKTARGRLDDMANARIESGWKSWAKKGGADITGQWSLNALLRLIVRILEVDGEAIIRKYRGPEYGPHAFQLQVLDSDRLDDLKNERLSNGGAIHMGVEYDAVSRPMAYHILKRKPAEWERGYTRESERIPAGDIIHLFLPEHAEQGRGVPWVYAAMMELVHLGAFEEAAVIAARVGASQMGVIQSPDGGDQLTGASEGVQSDPQIEAEPGTFPMLPPGYEIAGWNPKYPDAAVGPFLKSCLRGTAAGLGVAYHNLANDLEGVNYSSARIGEFDERDAWMALQNFVIEHLMQPVYEEWLNMQILTGRLPFDYERRERYQDIRFQGRRWAAIDPVKEVTANIDAINARLKSRTRVVAESGGDFEDVLEELSQEEALLREKKLTPAATPAAATTPKPATPASGDDDGENEDETETD
jgi:lambda family phage portal protein